MPPRAAAKGGSPSCPLPADAAAPAAGSDLGQLLAETDITKILEATLTIRAAPMDPGQRPMGAGHQPMYPGTWPWLHASLTVYLIPFRQTVFYFSKVGRNPGSLGDNLFFRRH